MTAAPIERRIVAAERRLVELGELRPIVLPAAMAQAGGLWKDARVTIATRAYEGDSVGYMRVAIVTGLQLCIGCLLVLPRPNRPVPVLGAELVSLGAARDTMITVDLSPMRAGDGRLADERAIAAVAPDTSAFASGGERPAWCREWCSSSAFHSHAAPDRLDDALAMLDRYVEGWISLAAAAAPDTHGADTLRARQHAYAHAHRTDDEALTRLATMFGRAWANEYVRTVLFPADPPK